MSSPSKIVVLTAIPGIIRRGNVQLAGTPYLPYARATWEYWCKRNDVELIVRDTAVPEFSHLPPVIQRWALPEMLMRQRNGDAIVAMLDADTMIRWDTDPAFFDFPVDQLAAVKTGDPGWIKASLRAYSPLFGREQLPLAHYFNSGLVVVSRSQAPTLRAFAEYYASRHDEFRHVACAGPYGVDQTALNLYLFQQGVRVFELPSLYNQLIRSVLSEPRLIYRLVEAWCLTGNTVSDLGVMAKRLPPEVFDFVQLSGIWHFTFPFDYTARTAFMAETWSRIRQYYR